MAACDLIDWSTFTFIARTGQTLVSADELTGLNGTFTFDYADREINYTLGTVSCLVDSADFIVSDINGNVSNVGTWYIHTGAITAPVATNDSFTVAAGSSGSWDINSNDTGNINLNSYEIVTFPATVKLTNNLDGTISYVVPSTSEGSESFTYKMYDPDGNVSNTATVNLTIQNAGTGTTGTICPVAGIDLTSFLSGSVTSGGSWAASGSNPSSPSIATPSSVDFSSANAGTYQFTYTIGSSSATITLLLPDYSVTLNTVSTPTNNPIASSITSQITFTTIGVTTANNIEIELDFNSGTSSTFYSPDVWRASSGEGSVTVEYPATGTYDITITATDSCGTAQTDTWTTITIS